MCAPLLNTLLASDIKINPSISAILKPTRSNHIDEKKEILFLTYSDFDKLPQPPSMLQQNTIAIYNSNLNDVIRSAESSSSSILHVHCTQTSQM